MAAQTIEMPSIGARLSSEERLQPPDLIQLSREELTSCIPHSQWVPDHKHKHCQVCETRFWLLRRRHHVRMLRSLRFAHLSDPKSYGFACRIHFAVPAVANAVRPYRRCRIASMAVVQPCT